jgi:heat shock protein HslJ
MNMFRLFAALATIGSLAAGCAESSAPSLSPTSLAATADQLSGTWVLLSMQLPGESAQAAPAGATYTATFTEGRLSTRVDCNTCSGTFVVSGQTLTAGPALACTRAACPTMAFENEYTRLLSGESSVALSNNALVLSSARGTLAYGK